MVDLVIGLAILLTFLGLGFYKKPVGLFAIVFLIPLAGKTVHGYGLKVSVLTLAVSTYLIASMISGKLSLRRLFPAPYGSHLLLLFGCICLSTGFYLTHDMPRNITLLDLVTSYNMCSFLSDTIAAMLLYLVINAEVKSEQMWFFCVRAFLWSIVYLGFIYLITGVAKIHLPEYISPAWSVRSQVGAADIASRVGTSAMRGQEVYFCGFIGHVENFAEYLFVVLAFAVTLILTKLRKKSDIILSACSIVLSLLLSFKAAVKAYPLMVVFFLVPLAIIGTKGKHRRNLIGVLVLGAFCFFCLQVFLSNTFLGKRFSDYSHKVKAVSGVKGSSTFSLIERGGIERFIVPTVETGGLFGIGPVVIFRLNGGAVPYHNLFFSLYLNFGAIGFIVYITFFFRPIIGLWRTRNRNADMRGGAAALVFLMVVLLLEGFKVSAFRVSYGVFSFWFILSLASSLVRLNVASGKATRELSKARPAMVESR